MSEPEEPTGAGVVAFLLGRLEACEVLICELMAERLADLPAHQRRAHRASLLHRVERWPQPTYAGPIDAEEKARRDGARRTCAAELIGRSVAMGEDYAAAAAETARFYDEWRRKLERSVGIEKGDGGAG